VRPRDAPCRWKFCKVTQDHSMSLEMIPFDRSRASYYWHSIITMGTCQCPLTVKHILVKDVRNKHFVASSIKYLFNSIEAHKIIDFIKRNSFL